MLNERRACIIHGDRLYIINPTVKSTIQFPSMAQYAAINPFNRLLFLSSGGISQLFDLDKKTKINQLNSTFPILFTKWLNEKVIVYINLNK